MVRQLGFAKFGETQERKLRINNITNISNKIK